MASKSDEKRGIRKRFTKGLKPVHEKAITALLSCSTTKEAAKQAGVPYHSLLEWMRHPVFMSAYRHHVRTATQHVISLMAANHIAAYGVMVDALKGEDRRLALQAAIHIDNKNREELYNNDLLQRLEALELKAAKFKQGEVA